MDELRLQVATINIVKDSCVLILTEIWLQASIADSAVALEGRQVTEPIELRLVGNNTVAASSFSLRTAGAPTLEL